MARRKLPEILVECAACGDDITISSCLRLGDSHADVCPARPVLLRLDSDGNGRWVPVIQSHQLLTDHDRARIRKQIAEMVAEHQRRA